MVYVTHLASRIRTELVPSWPWSQTCVTYTIVVCTVKNSCWWTEELSETCRILFQKYMLEISASSWFYCTKNLSRCTVTWTSKFLKFRPLHSSKLNLRCMEFGWPFWYQKCQGVVSLSKETRKWRHLYLFLAQPSSPLVCCERIGSTKNQEILFD